MNVTPPSPAPPTARYLRWRLLSLAAVVALLLTAWQTGLFRLMGEPQQLKAALVALGPWGWVAFVAAYTALQPFGVPGTVFVLAAPLIWPWPTAFVLSMVGTMAASVVGFSFARFMARDYVLARLPPRLRAYEAAMTERAFVTVVLLRLVLWMPQGLHAFFGVSRVSFWTHFWGSLIGYVPPLLLTAYFGERALTWLAEAPAWLWVVLGAAALVAAGLLVWWRRRGKNRKAPGA